MFVASLDAPELGDADRHHLERVLRLRAGDPLTVGDGAGRWRPVRFGSDLEPDGAIVDGASADDRRCRWGSRWSRASAPSGSPRS